MMKVYYCITQIIFMAMNNVELTSHVFDILSLFVGSDDEDDSNLLTSDHDVISGVLREEFGPSYDVLYGPRSQMSGYSPFH